MMQDLNSAEMVKLMSDGSVLFNWPLIEAQAAVPELSHETVIARMVLAARQQAVRDTDMYEAMKSEVFRQWMNDRTLHFDLQPPLPRGAYDAWVAWQNDPRRWENRQDPD